MPRKQLITAVAIGLYVVLFYATRLPTVEGITGEPFRRVEFFGFLLDPGMLLEQWFGRPPELAIADRLPVLGLAALVVTLGTATGRLLMRAIGVDRLLTGPENFVFAAAVGLNVVSTFTMLAGLAGQLHRAVFLVPGAVVIAAAVWSLRRRSFATPGQRDGPGPLDRRWGWLIAPFAAVIVLGAMLPSADFDVREYHLQAPKEFYLQGRVDFLPHNVYADMPLGAEMHSLLAMVLAGDWWLGALAGKTVTALFAPLTALALWTAGRRLAGRTAAGVAALAYLSVPWIVEVSTAGLIDGVLGAYLLLAACAMWLAVTPGTSAGAKRDEVAPRRSAAAPQAAHFSPLATRHSLLLLAGYLAGGAAATKYTGLLFVVMPLGMVAAYVGLVGLTTWNGQAGKPDVPRGRAGPGGLAAAVRPAILFAVAAAAGCGPWLAKNAVTSGNPTYPLFYEVFGGRTWTPEKNDRWNNVHRPRDFSPAAFGRDMARVAMTSEWLSPWLMPLAALALTRKRHRTLAAWLWGYFGVVIALWWLLTHRIDRFWVPALPLVALAAGIGASWEELKHGPRTAAAALAGFLAVGSLGNFLVAASSHPGQYHRLFVSLSRAKAEVLSLRPWHPRLNQEARGGCVLLVGEADVFDFDVPILYSTCFDDNLFIELVQGRTPEETRRAMVERGITHVFVDWSEIHRYRTSAYGFPQFVQPAEFQRLVRAGVLEELPEIKGHPGRAYRVIRR